MPPQKRKSPNAASTRRQANNSASGSGSSHINESGRVTKRPDGDRKRTQNRIAQKCLRERRAASGRHVASMLEVMQFATETDQVKQYSMLVDAQVKLIEYNQEMEDALFRMRKKLLSLSNAAAIAAEDPVFDRILGRQAPQEDSINNEQRQETPEDQESPAESDRAKSPTLGSDAGRMTTITTSAELLGIAAPVEIEALTDSMDPAEIMFDTPVPEGGNEPQQSLRDSIKCCFTFDEQDIPQIGECLLPMEDASSQPNMFCDAASDLGAMLQVSPWDICSFAPTQKLTLYSCVEFNRKMLQAASICISRIRQMALVRHLSTDLITKLVAVATVNIVGTYTGLHQYLYGVNVAAYMERAVYWRLTGAGRSLVPELFRPTPLQSSMLSTTVGPVIDFLYWPEMRDQLILAGESVDKDAFFRDLLLNTVIEVPGRNLAVNIMSQFRQQESRQEDGSQYSSCNRSSSNNNCLPTSTSASGTKVPTSALDEGWVYFEIDRTDGDFRSWAADPIEQALSLRLWRKVEQLTEGTDPALFMQNEDWFEDAPSNAPPLESALGRIDPKFCAERTRLGQLFSNTLSWKINKELANKYPFLGYSSICTKCETVSFVSL